MTAKTFIGNLLSKFPEEKRKIVKSSGLVRYEINLKWVKTKIALFFLLYFSVFAFLLFLWKSDSLHSPLVFVDYHIRFLAFLFSYYIAKRDDNNRAFFYFLALFFLVDAMSFPRIFLTWNGEFQSLWKGNIYIYQSHYLTFFKFGTDKFC